MDFYIQILCRFQKCKQKVPPQSLLSNEKSRFTPPKDWGVDFSLLRSDGGGTFRLHFWNLHKIWI